MKSFSIIFFVSFFCLYGCQDSPTSTNPPLLSDESDTSITYTDWLGNFLGGDTTDWCGGSGSQLTYSFQAAYPNPVDDSVSINFSFPQDTHVKIFFRNGADTLFVYNAFHEHGYYVVMFPKSRFNFHNQYKRVYMTADNFFCYGDIKFN